MAWSRTFGQMKTDLGLWLGVDTNASNPNYIRLPEDVREQCISQARRSIFERRDLRFFEATDPITTADGDNSNGLPTDYGRPYMTYYWDSTTGKKVEIEFLTRSEWLNKYDDDDDSKDTPTHYTIYGDQYLWLPTPDAIYTIYHDYFQQPVELTGSNDDDFLDKGWDAIFWDACLRGCDFIMEDSRRAIFEKRAIESLGFLSNYLMRAKYSGGPVQSEEP